MYHIKNFWITEQKKINENTKKSKKEKPNKRTLTESPCPCVRQRMKEHKGVRGS